MQSINKPIAVTHADKIAARLREVLQPTHLDVKDEGYLHVGHANAGAGHFRIEIVASCFVDKSRVARHRMVYNALQDPIGFSIHALAIQAATPDEYAKTLTSK